MEDIDISAMVGHTLTKVTGLEPNSDVVTFYSSNGAKWRMQHDQDCCESVDIAEVIGDVSDILDTPIISATEYSNTPGDSFEQGHHGSYTWTFYDIRTHKGQVTIRWFGTSNGYYSESVCFARV